MNGNDALTALLVLAFAALTLWLAVRILGKAGHSGWWCLVTLVPLVNLVMVWVFAFARWPAVERAHAAPPRPDGDAPFSGTGGA